MPDDVPGSDPGRALEHIFGDDNPPSVEELSAFLAQRKVNSIQRWSSPEAVEVLKERCAALNDKVELKKGDVVRWKHHLKNKTFPAYGVPAVVVDILEEPVTNPEQSAGSVYFQEKLDIVLGFYGEGEPGSEDDIRTYHFDSRRFELHPSFAPKEE